MSSTLCISTKMNDKRYLVTAIKRAIEDIFPGLSDKMQVSDENSLPLYGMNQGEVRIPKTDLVSDGNVVVLTKSGQRIIYPSRAEAETDIKSKKLDVESVQEEQQYLYGDIGYMKTKDGTYQKVMDDMDMKSAVGETFDKRVQAYYDGMKMLNHAVKKGARAQTTDVRSTGLAQAEVEIEMSDELLVAIAAKRNVAY